MKIKGERSWTGEFTIRKEDDPNLAVGDVRWIETKEPSLMRPLTRKKWLIASRSEDEGSVTYKLEPASNDTH